MTPQERADAIVGEFEQTTMGCEDRYADHNHLRGVRVGPMLKLIESAITEAVAEEREACAKLADATVPVANHGGDDDSEATRDRIAAAIRAR